MGCATHHRASQETMGHRLRMMEKKKEDKINVHMRKRRSVLPDASQMCKRMREKSDRIRRRRERTKERAIQGKKHHQVQLSSAETSDLPGHSGPAKPNVETREWRKRRRNSQPEIQKNGHVGRVKGRILFCHAGLVSVSVL